MSKILLIALIIGTASAATWMSRLPEKPSEFANKTGCYVKEINDVVPFGATLTPLGYCYRINCGEEMMNYASCGVVYTDIPKCFVTSVDKSKPYPECCPHIKCDDENKLL